jgi:ElaA protein
MTMSTTMTAMTQARSQPHGPHEAAADAGENSAEQVPGEVDWRICRFSELSPVELARIYRARQQVFTIEQQCIYLDADEFDEVSWHIAAWSPALALPLAYARLVNPGGKYAEPSMGRVITTAAARGVGLGRELVRRVLEHSALVFPRQGVRISAQERLARFYAEFGFAPIGEPYLEDGIPHLEMLRRA